MEKPNQIAYMENKNKIQKWLKENWFKLGLLLVVTVLSVFYIVDQKQQHKISLMKYCEENKSKFKTFSSNQLLRGFGLGETDGFNNCMDKFN